MSVVKKEEKGNIIQPKKMGLLVENPVYKPVSYTHLTLPTIYSV